MSAYTGMIHCYRFVVVEKTRLRKWERGERERDTNPSTVPPTMKRTNFPRIHYEQMNDKTTLTDPDPSKYSARDVQFVCNDYSFGQIPECEKARIGVRAP